MLYSLGKILGKRKAQLVPQLHIFQVEADILLLSNSCASESRLSSFVVYSHCHSISCSNTDSQSCHILFCLAFMSAHFQNDASSWAGKCPAMCLWSVFHCWEHKRAAALFHQNTKDCHVLPFSGCSGFFSPVVSCICGSEFREVVGFLWICYFLE